MADSRRRMSLFSGLGGEDRGKSDGKLAQALAALALIVFLMVLLLVAFASLKTVPNVVGLPVSEAKAKLERGGFSVGEEIPKAASAAQEDKVLEQAPASGNRVLGGTAVDLTVAELSASTTTDVDLGQTAGGTKSEGIPLPEWNGNPPREPTIVPYDSSANPSGVEVPSAMGMSQSQAFAVLAAKGLNGVIRSARSTTNVPVGTVVGQSPGAESFVPSGSTVYLYVSAGPPSAGVPYSQAPYN